MTGVLLRRVSRVSRVSISSPPRPPSDSPSHSRYALRSFARSLLHSVKLTGSQTRQAVGVKSRVRLFEGDESKQTQKLKSLVTVERKGGDVALGWSLSHAMHVADVKYADKIKTTVDFKVPLSGGGGGLGGASVVAGVKLDVA